MSQLPKQSKKPTKNEELDLLLETAIEAGSPEDQVTQFLSCNLIPLPWQWNFHAVAREADLPDGPVDIGLGGARGPGKSFSVLAQVAIDDCQRVDNLKCLFLRQTGLSAEESFNDLIDKVLRGRIKHKYAKNTLFFDNGSKILLGGFHSDKDIDQYIGIEYDIIIVEELNQLTEDKYMKLRGSLRTSKPNWRPRTYTSFNPGGIGHQWIKERYIKPYREDRETETRFIGSTYISNPYLDDGYIKYLENLPGDLGRAWREGDWDLFAGQFFTELRRDIHGFESFPMSPHWTKVIAMDYGYDHPTCVLWGAIDNDGDVYIYKEYVCRQKTYTEVAEKILELTTQEEKIDYLVADPAIWAKKGNQNGMSGSEELQTVLDKRKIVVTPANNDRVNGWGLCREYLRVTKRQGKYHSKLHLSKNLNWLWETMPAQQHDPKKPEDMLKQLNDDGADCLRYLLMSRVEPAKEKTKKENKDRYGYIKKDLDLRAYQSKIPSYKGNIPT